jgi:protein CpxP
MQEQLAAAKTKNEQAIRALLTPEQQKTYDQAKQKNAERRAEMDEFKAWKAQRAAKAE